MSHTIEGLKLLSDEQLIKEHDEKAKHTVVGTQYYMNELDKRSRDRKEEATYKLSLQTQTLARRTYWQSWFSVGASLLALGLTLYSFLG